MGERLVQQEHQLGKATTLLLLGVSVFSCIRKLQSLRVGWSIRHFYMHDLPDSPPEQGKLASKAGRSQPVLYQSVIKDQDHVQQALPPTFIVKLAKQSRLDKIAEMAQAFSQPVYLLLLLKYGQKSYRPLVCYFCLLLARALARPRDSGWQLGLQTILLLPPLCSKIIMVLAKWLEWSPRLMLGTIGTGLIRLGGILLLMRA